MRIDGFTGNEKVRQSLSEAINSGRLGHGLVIAGRKGYGVNCFAHLLAADIINGDEHQKDLAVKGESPLVQIVSGSGASGQIKVESIRNINENVNFSSLSGEKRVVLIQNCENFNQNSANALLKNLEEPKDDITYILTTNNIQRLLATIKSRCNIFTLNRPTDSQCREYFKSYQNKNSIDELIDIYSGNIGFIKNAADSVQRFAILQNALGAMEKIEKDEKYLLAKRLFVYNKKKEDFVLFLQDMQYICAKALTQNSVNTLQAVQAAYKALEQNANLSLVIENFIISA